MPAMNLEEHRTCDGDKVLLTRPMNSSTKEVRSAMSNGRTPCMRHGRAKRLRGPGQSVTAGERTVEVFE